MDLYERDDLKEFLIELFGSKARGWPMNEQMFNLTYELVIESNRCSGMMDFVPRPMPPGVSAMRYLADQARGIFLRTIRQNKKQYVSCVKQVSRNMATQFLEAAYGV